MEDWAEIRRLHRSEGIPIKAIARVLGISRNTVRAALASDGPPKYVRKPAGSIVDAVEPQIRELLRAYPTMPATVIAERIGGSVGSRYSRSGSLNCGRCSCHRIRPGAPPMQLGKSVSVICGSRRSGCPSGSGLSASATQLPVVTMVTGYARWLSARLIPSRQAEDLFAGWWSLIETLGATPRVLVWDGEGAIGRHRGGRSELTEACQGFRGVLGSKVIICKPRDPEAKGLVERAHDYLERSFLPGRTFTSPADFNAQLQAWVGLANSRIKRVLGCAPAERIAADRAAMLMLPPVAPVVGWRRSLRLPRDHYVRLDGNDYSVHPSVIGRRVEVSAGLDRVRVFCDGRIVADHERIWATHQSLTDPAHVTAAEALRRSGTRLRPVDDEHVQQRALSDYDAIFGLDEGAA